MARPPSTFVLAAVLLGGFLPASLQAASAAAPPANEDGASIDELMKLDPAVALPRLVSLLRAGEAKHAAVTRRETEVMRAVTKASGDAFKLQDFSVCGTMSPQERVWVARERAARLLSERTRLLAWWDKEGRKRFR